MCSSDLSDNRDDKRITTGIKKAEGSVVFYVEDNGIGIEESDTARVFEFGFKKRKGGHGYGLHHSAIMAKDLGGKIQVKSEGIGKGARFELIIPIDLA